MADLAAPVRVSPLIKFGRWSFLALGVVYGAFHHNRLTKKENALREAEAKRKAIEEPIIAEQKRLAAEKEIKELEELTK